MRQNVVTYGVRFPRYNPYLKPINMNTYTQVEYTRKNNTSIPPYYGMGYPETKSGAKLG